MVCTRNQASLLLHSLRTDYQLLTPEERNQVKYFILGFYPNDTAVQPPTNEIGSGTLIKQFQKSLMQAEVDKEEAWSAIRYLDPDEREKDNEANAAAMIAVLAVLVIAGAAWVLLWFRLRQP
jgi:hypothetical protein